MDFTPYVHYGLFFFQQFSQIEPFTPYSILRIIIYFSPKKTLKGSKFEDIQQIWHGYIDYLARIVLTKFQVAKGIGVS